MALRIAEIERAEKAGQNLVVLAVCFDRSCQRVDDIPLHDFGQKGKGFMAEAVAGVARVLIGLVLAVSNVLLAEVVVDLAAPRVEERSQEDEFLAAHEKLAFEVHSFQSRRTSQEIEEAGFGLVFGVVGQKNPRAACLARYLGIQLMTGLAGGGLQ